MTIAIVVCLAAIGLIWYLLFRKTEPGPLGPFPRKWKKILKKNVRYYRHLDKAERKRFHTRIQRFLQQVTVTGVETEINVKDKLLVAASGIIPTFGFEAWNHYPRLKEVLVYGTSFRRGDFATTGEGRNIGGMVGGGYLSGKLLLSKPALRQGFGSIGRNNTGIHEFVHLLDMADGNTDGVPEYFLENTYVIPWVEMMRGEMEAIERGKSDIDDYATTNKAEFLAVASEYFFNSPHKFAANHPRIFALMEHMFEQDLDEDGGIGTVKGEPVLKEIEAGER